MENLFCTLLYADETVQDVPAVNTRTIVNAFRTYPWKDQAAKANRLDSAAEMHICSGRNGENGDMLIVGYDDGSFLVMLNLFKTDRILGIIPRKRNIDLTLENANAIEVEECLRNFVEYSQPLLCEWVEQRQRMQRKIES